MPQHSKEQIKTNQNKLKLEEIELGKYLKFLLDLVEKLLLYYWQFN